MNDLELAVVHDAKNKLGEVVFRLEARGDCFSEIESIIHASNSLTNLILWHRQQDGALRINIDSASPADLLEEIATEFRRFFPNITIEFDTSKAPIFWFYDETYIRLALVNVLHNACRFANKIVRLSASVVNGKLILVIRDDGAGYNDVTLERHQQQKSAEISLHGTGVGLLLAASIARMHASNGFFGQVMLRNDHGAVFEMVLP